MLLAALPAAWRQRATELDPYAPAAAHAFRTAADDLDRSLATADEDTVTLGEAATLGGYSVDHLQRLVRTGRLENVGRKGKPRIRRSQVPARPGHAALLDGAVTGKVLPTAVFASVVTGDTHP
jgi:hypothetical protein